MQMPDVISSWEARYREGYGNRYPFDEVVSFICRFARAHRPRTVRVLDVGCGPGNHLEVLKAEGCDFYGIDGSETAIQAAVARVGAPDKVVSGSFERLPFATELFDACIDRMSIMTTPRAIGLASIAEVNRVLKPGGKFLFTCLTDEDDRFLYATAQEDGFVTDVAEQVKQQIEFRGYQFYSVAEVKHIFSVGNNWVIRELKLTRDQTILPARLSLCSLLVVAEKAA
jgi:SAM-dependent methyltransferase